MEDWWRLVRATAHYGYPRRWCFTLYSVLTGAILSFIFVVTTTDSHHQNILYYGWNVCINYRMATSQRRTYPNWGGFLTMAVLSLHFVVNIFLKQFIRLYYRYCWRDCFVGLTIWDGKPSPTGETHPAISEASRSLPYAVHSACTWISSTCSSTCCAFSVAADNH